MLKNIEKLAKSFENVEEVRKAIRSVQTQKSRMKQQKSRKDYDERMTEILQKEQLLKEVRDYFEPKTTPVPKMTKKDIELLNWDETQKAIKSIFFNILHTSKFLIFNFLLISLLKVSSVRLEFY